MKFSDLNIVVKETGSEQQKAHCPECTPTRKNKKDASLSVNVKQGVWNCHNCGFSGSLEAYDKFESVRKEADMPKEVKQYSNEFISWFKKRGLNKDTLVRNMVYERKNLTACFPFFRNMNLVNVKFRSLKDKKMWQIKKDAGSESCFMGLDRVEDKSVIICEGEIDFLTYFQCGVNSVISVPQGAPSANAKNFDEEFNYYDKYAIAILSKCKTIFLAVDDDEPGIVLREELARRLGKERCKIAQYPEGCKDANDVLMKYGKDAVLKTIVDAKPLPISGIVRVMEHERDLNTYRTEGFKPGWQSGVEGIDKLYSIKPKMFHVWTGVPGSGKTSILNQILVDTIKHNSKEHLPVGMFAAEDRPLARGIARLQQMYEGRDVFTDGRKPMNEQSFQRSLKFVHDNFIFAEPTRKDRNVMIHGTKIASLSSLDGILALVRVMVEQYGIRIFVLDNWAKVEHAKNDKFQSETGYIGESIDKMIDCADMNDLCFICVAHTAKPRYNPKTKNYEVPVLSEISGSAHWFNKPDTGIVVHRNKHENGQYNPRLPTKFLSQKQRFEEIGDEGYTMMWKDFNRGGRFVMSKDDLEKSKHKYKGKQKEIILPDDPVDITEGGDVEDSLPF